MENYITMDEIVDRIHSHPDVKSTEKSYNMLKQLGAKQDLVRKPRLHIIKSKKTNPIKNIFDLQ